MEEEQLEFEGFEVESIPDKPNTAFYDPKAGQILELVTTKFNDSEDARLWDEQRWMRAYRNYRGLYGPDMQWTESEKSQVFVKITKTKVLAAYQSIVDVLFGTDKFPISIAPTALPDGVEESVHMEMQDMPEGIPEEERRLKPGETLQDLQERLGALKTKLGPVMEDIKPGPGTTPTSITFHPAAVSAAKMEKKIQDQLDECNANKSLRNVAFEAALFGTGVMQGPFAIDKEYPKWEEDGEYDPEIKTIPSVEFVSIWNFYPDPDADNMEEAEYVIRRHKMTRSKLRSLKKRPLFRKNAIDTAISIGESYTEKWWETQLEEEQTGSAPERFEVLEFWGNVDTEVLTDYGLAIPPSLRDKEELSVNIWVCNNQLLRMVMNPFKPANLPFHAVPYETNPYSFFGVGVAENMDDTQTLMNGFMRMAIDNAALAGNMIIEIDEDSLTPGQDLTIYPGKVFRRSGGAPGQAIFGTKFPSTAKENMDMFDKARQLSDESTGIPSFAHGQMGVSGGIGRTSSGISMMMGAAAGSVRSVIKNIDDYLLAPLGKALYHFNMQFDNDEEIKGDLEVKARGTESLMANEVRSQRLMQLLSIVQNPMLAPFAKMDYIIREISKSLDLDPDKVVNSLSDAAIQAKMLQAMQPAQPPEGQVPPGQDTEGAPNVPTPGNTQQTGNGNIGPGGVNTPQEEGFTGQEPRVQ